MAKIPLKKHWVRTDPWRGYYEYENAVAGGCFLAGDRYHNLSEMERIKRIKAILRKHGIAHRLARARTSNVFSQVYDIVVEPKQVKRAKRLLKDVV